MARRTRHKAHNIIWLVGVSVLLIIAVNVIFFFSEINTFGGNGPITGAATLECQYTFDGIRCPDGSDYLLSDTCEAGQVSVCTNQCEIERSKVTDDRLCPTYCTSYCVTSEDAELLENTQISLV